MTNWLQLQQRCNVAALAVFGTTPGELDFAPVTGDFVEPSDDVFLEGVSASANVPRYVMLSSLVPAPCVGLALVLFGAVARSFKVADVKRDGYGFSTLLLEAAP